MVGGVAPDNALAPPAAASIAAGWLSPGTLPMIDIVTCVKGEVIRSSGTRPWRSE